MSGALLILGTMAIFALGVLTITAITLWLLLRD